MMIGGGSIMAYMYIFPMQEGTVNMMDLLPLLDGSGDSCQQQPTEPPWVPSLLATSITRESVHTMASIISRNYNAISISFRY
jgi:hypothetical protein